MRADRIATVATLGALAGLHFVWATGSSLPARDRRTLADTVAGTDAVPGPAECVAVGSALATAAVVAAGVLPVGSRANAVLGVGAASVLAVRGILGVSGRTSVLVPWLPSERFIDLDRHYYGPLCLALAGGMVSSVVR